MLLVSFGSLIKVTAEVTEMTPPKFALTTIQVLHILEETAVYYMPILIALSSLLLTIRRLLLLCFAAKGLKEYKNQLNCLWRQKL